MQGCPRCDRQGPAVRGSPDMVVGDGHERSRGTHHAAMGCRTSRAAGERASCRPAAPDDLDPAGGLCLLRWAARVPERRQPELGPQQPASGRPPAASCRAAAPARAACPRPRCRASAFVTYSLGMRYTFSSSALYRAPFIRLLPTRHTSFLCLTQRQCSTFAAWMPLQEQDMECLNNPCAWAP